VVGRAIVEVQAEQIAPEARNQTLILIVRMTAAPEVDQGADAITRQPLDYVIPELP